MDVILQNWLLVLVIPHSLTALGLWAHSLVELVQAERSNPRGLGFFWGWFFLLLIIAMLWPVAFLMAGVYRLLIGPING